MNFSARYQILPLSQPQFSGWDAARLRKEFFQEVLVASADEDGCCTLAFKSQDLVLQDEVKLVFFQFEASLVACAILVDDELRDGPDEEGFTGSYVFLADSIATFEPVDAASLKGFFPDFEHFNQSAQYLDAKGIEGFVKFLAGRLVECDLEGFRPLETIADILKDAEELYETDPEVLALLEAETEP